MVELMKIMVISFKRSHAYTATLSANPAAGHHRPTPPLETSGHSQAILGQSLVGSLLLSLGCWCTRFCLYPPRVYVPVLCKFWQLYGGVNDNLLQEGLCHTQVPLRRGWIILENKPSTYWHSEVSQSKGELPAWSISGKFTRQQALVTAHASKQLCNALFVYERMTSILKQIKWKKVKVTQSCPTLLDPMDYTVLGILQARILEWVAFPFSRGSFQSRNRIQVFRIAGRFLTSWATREALKDLKEINWKQKLKGKRKNTENKRRNINNFKNPPKSLIHVLRRLI